MKFSGTEPPKEHIEKEFPVLDSKVTVSNCWYYLSLLERFVYATKDLEEDKLKMYLVRAEYRYHTWISERRKKMLSKNIDSFVPPTGKINHLFKQLETHHLFYITKQTLRSSGKHICLAHCDIMKIVGVILNFLVASMRNWKCLSKRL
jgi:hypothetical protein